MKYQFKKYRKSKGLLVKQCYDQASAKSLTLQETTCLS